MKSKLLPILLFLLILLNGALIFMLLSKPHEKRENKKQRNFLTTQLNFSETQKADFKKLDRVHRKLMIEIDKEVRHNKDVLFNSFSGNNFNLDSIANEIGLLEAKKELEVFRFFKEVRTLCSSEQKIKFDKIIKEALKGGDRKPPKNGKMPPPRNGGHPPI